MRCLGFPRWLSGSCAAVIAFASCSLAADAFAQSGKNRPGSLDGAYVNAVENEMIRGSNQINLAYGLYPLDPYYNAFDIDGAYSYFFSDWVGWEVIRFHLIFTSEKDLTRELAEDYGANPEKIDRLKTIFTSSLLFPLIYGKQVFTNEYYFYHRVIFLLGVGQMNTEMQSAFTMPVGVRGDFAIDERFSWTLEGRYHVAFNQKQDNAMMFALGTAFNF